MLNRLGNPDRPKKSSLIYKKPLFSQKQLNCYWIFWDILGTSMILCFTLAEEGDNDEACQEKQG